MRVIVTTLALRKAALRPKPRSNRRARCWTVSSRAPPQPIHSSFAEGG